MTNKAYSETHCIANYCGEFGGELVFLERKSLIIEDKALSMNSEIQPQLTEVNVDTDTVQCSG